MVFSGIFKNLPCKNHRGGSCHLATRVEGAPYPPGRAPLPRGPMVALLHLFLHPSSSSVSHKHEKPTQARVRAPVAVIFDLLAQSTSHKTAWGDCSLKIMKRFLRGSSSRSSKEKQNEEAERPKYNFHVPCSVGGHSRLPKPYISCKARAETTI